MALPELTHVDSKRFESWFYDGKTGELYVKYPPSKNHPRGTIYVYANVAPEEFEEGLEADSKGSWLNQEVIAKPKRHPYRVVGTPEEQGESRQEFENDRMGQTGADNAAKLREVHLVPEPIRAIAVLPEAPLIAMPQILPPDVKEGAKPFNQVVKERALAIAAAVPFSLAVTNAESYKALGTALVVIQTERRAVDKALETIAKPMIEMKRGYDVWRNEVLVKYDEAERRLNTALLNFKRAEDNRVREEEMRQRRENEARARRQAEEAAEARRKQQAEEARQMEEAAQARKAEAQEALKAAEASQASSPTHDSLFGASGAAIADSLVAEAKQEIDRAEADLKDAAELAATPVEVGPIHVAPAVIAKTDLKVAGLRTKPPLWRWRIPAKFFRNAEIAAVTPIRRNALRDPDQIPAEYWVLDEKAIQAHVKSMDGVISIPQVEPYDLNAS